jgi:hypothetical protein
LSTGKSLLHEVEDREPDRSAEYDLGFAQMLTPAGPADFPADEGVRWFRLARQNGDPRAGAAIAQACAENAPGGRAGILQRPPTMSNFAYIEYCIEPSLEVTPNLPN